MADLASGVSSFVSWLRHPWKTDWSWLSRDRIQKARLDSGDPFAVEYAKETEKGKKWYATHKKSAKIAREHHNLNITELKNSELPEYIKRLSSSGGLRSMPLYAALVTGVSSREPDAEMSSTGCFVTCVRSEDSATLRAVHEHFLDNTEPEKGSKLSVVLDTMKTLVMNTEGKELHVVAPDATYGAKSHVFLLREQEHKDTQDSKSQGEQENAEVDGQETSSGNSQWSCPTYMVREVRQCHVARDCGQLFAYDVDFDEVHLLDDVNLLGVDQDTTSARG